MLCTAIKAGGPGGDGELCIGVVDLLYIIFIDNRPHNLRKLLQGVSADQFKYIIQAIPFQLEKVSQELREIEQEELFWILEENLKYPAIMVTEDTIL